MEKNVEKKYIYQAITKEYIGLDDFDEFKEIVDSSVNSKIENISLTMQELKKEVTVVEQKLNIVVDDISGTNEKVIQNEINIGKLEDGMDNVTTELAESAIKVINLESSSENLKTRMTDTETINKEQTSEIQKLLDRITVLENKPSGGAIFGEFRYFKKGSIVPAGWERIQDGEDLNLNHILMNSFDEPLQTSVNFSSNNSSGDSNIAFTKTDGDRFGLKIKNGNGAQASVAFITAELYIYKG